MNMFLRRYQLIMLTAMAVVLFCGCREFFEPSLENEEMDLIAPSDGIETSSYQLTFLWESNSDALRYRLQIASPSFSHIEKLLLDTLVTTYKFTFTLDPGKYQWRVRGENGSSQTTYAVRNLTIQPSSLTDQVVQLVSPANLFLANQPAIDFEWLTLYGATGYRLQIDKNNFSGTGGLVLDAVVSGNKFTASLTSEGNYQYRVRAENATENSKWSMVRSFGYDQTPPAKVILSAPANRQTVTNPVSLTWAAIADASAYEVLVYKSDSVSLVNTSFPKTVQTNSFSFVDGTAQQTFVWRVRALDKAGNKGELSNFYSFTMQ